MNLKIYKQAFIVLAVGMFIVPQIASAIEIPIISLIVSENTSGYICSEESIGCSSLSSIYKIEKRGENLYICSSGSISCSPLSDLYKTKIHDEDTTYICLGSSFGCGSLSALYKLKKYDADTTYVCSGDSIGCSSLSALYKLRKYDESITYACSSDSIGCSSLSALYKLKKTDAQSSYGGNYTDNQNTKNACPANSTLSGTNCSCNDGYVFNGNACITYTQSCQTKLGINSYGDKQQCYCSTGYSPYNGQCIASSDYCKLTYGDHIFANSTNCVCESGYTWSSDRCIKTEVPPIQSPQTILPLYDKYKAEIIDSQKEQQKDKAAPVIKKQEAEKAITLEATTTPPNTEIKEKSNTPEKRSFFSNVFWSVKAFFSSIFK